MSIYYFDCRDGEKIARDDMGLEFASIDDAKAGAVQALTELTLGIVPGWERRVLAIEVRDQLGPVMEIRMAFEIVRLRPN